MSSYVDAADQIVLANIKKGSISHAHSMLTRTPRLVYKHIVYFNSQDIQDKYALYPNSNCILGFFIFSLTRILQTGSGFESTGGAGRFAYMSLDSTSKAI